MDDYYYGQRALVVTAIVSSVVCLLAHSAAADSVAFEHVAVEHRFGEGRIELLSLNIGLDQS